jgi:hypothetical protein
MELDIKKSKFSLTVGGLYRKNTLPQHIEIVSEEK